ncbi:SOS response-associated peptidase [Rhodococcus antarcticus]|jgi:putative SOS response-associated peptidase YedK|uniref:Abasic site processing protein n=1 Tax=Rhodococcus antarcticus TaxID=2987751 RepID=A0ABY6NW43_9NOCA|nr:SOS response-associated peptidase [Rhodococcus antarcticus]UZJ23612.1 SOS response-associated peptidase [Rhodococcus antarcticus]
MCGRYASTATDADLLDLFSVVEAVGDELPVSYNVAPTQTVRTVLERVPRGARDAAPVRQLRSARWGLVPSWAKDLTGGARLINARSETVTEKPSFKAAAARRRCLVPAAGYFEWEPRDGVKVPHFLHGDGVLAFAGLYELWRPRAVDGEEPGEWVWSVTVLTTTAADTLGHIHDRSPVVLPPELQGAWLDPATTDPARVRALLEAVPEPQLTPREVGRAVGNVRNDTPDLLDPV